jgi:ribosomal protein S18 acetylase RimI-like enzyme
MWFAAESSTRSKLTIRWAHRTDLGPIAAVERAAYGLGAIASPKLEEKLHEKSCAALLAETDRAVGYLLYHLDVTRRTVHIARLAVVPQQQRRSIGTQLLGRLFERLHPLAGVRISLLLPESNLTGQLFAKARGFRAIQIYHGFFGDADAYLFEFQPRR